MQSLLSIFRSQHVEEALFALGYDTGLLTVTLTCENGKRHRHREHDLSQYDIMRYLAAQL